MNRQELIAAIADRTSLSNSDVESILGAQNDIIIEELKRGGEVKTEYGKWEASKRQARTGRNPQTGEPIEIAASVVPKFKPGKKLKDAVNPQSE